jgi:predicted phage terminase large subunit-like protein
LIISLLERNSRKAPRASISDSSSNGSKPIGIEETGQQGGFFDELYEDEELLDISIEGIRPDSDKLTRALPWISRAEAGKIYLVRGSWIHCFIEECFYFTGDDDEHDDQIDAVSGVYRMCCDYAPSTVF